MDLVAPCKGCIPPGFEVHLQKYLLSLKATLKCTCLCKCTCALAKTCAFQCCLEREQVLLQMHFKSRWNTSLARGNEVHATVGVNAVQPTDEFRCHFFQPWRCLKQSVDDSCKFDLVLKKEWVHNEMGS